jgi:hypothetical protein
MQNRAFGMKGVKTGVYNGSDVHDKLQYYFTLKEFINRNSGNKALDIIEDPPSHVTFKRQNAQKWYFHME